MQAEQAQAGQERNRLPEVAAQGLQSPQQFLDQVASACRPVVIRGLVNDWPAVAAARQSAATLGDYLLRFDSNEQAEVFIGEPQIAGRYYYTNDLKGFNFERCQMAFGDALNQMVAGSGQPGHRSMYMGSSPTDLYLPGFSQQNPMRLLSPSVSARIWLGHASNVAAHYDTLDNIACVVAGTRRFTLFPPHTISKLYVGPIDHNMAGQPVSLAAAANDDERYPLFREVRDEALVAQLDAGDAIYIPKLWWHQIEALGDFNALVNYWWDAFGIADQPSVALLLSMITIAERPPAERQAWKAFFDHYAFRTRGHPLAHLPPEQHGALGPLLPDNYTRIRAYILRALREGQS